MSLNIYPLDADHTGFPRVSGDEPWALWANLTTALFSPRERG